MCKLQTVHVRESLHQASVLTLLIECSSLATYLLHLLTNFLKIGNSRKARERSIGDRITKWSRETYFLHH